jgi:stage V sporulation protein AF
LALDMGKCLANAPERKVPKKTGIGPLKYIFNRDGSSLWKKGGLAMQIGRLSGSYREDCRMLDEELRIGKSFDVIGRDICVAGRPARLYFVDGFVKDEVMEKIMEFLMGQEAGTLTDTGGMEAFCHRFVPYVEADRCAETERLVTAVLSGTVALLVEGFQEAALIDARTYPTRGVEEPGDDKVLRGSRDGFVETLVFNTALIRRRLRCPALTMEYLQAGRKSRTDIVLCYLEGKADSALVERVRKKIASLTVDMLAMGQESLAEALIGRQWYNPFPKVRYTERPDAAAASVAEGSILVVVDNSPSVMILPTSFFDFLQDTNDFYFPPLVGSYLRLVRIAVFFLTLFLTPVWYLLIRNPEYIPAWLSFIEVAEPNGVPVLVQLLIIEFVIDGLKLASLNTPNVLSNSFSVVGALILGDFAVQARWFVPEVVLYMAFVAIANFTQPSFELGYALKLFRVLLLLLTGLFNLWGFVGGAAFLIAMIATTANISGRRYLYPLIPWNGRAMASLLIRRPLTRHHS